MSNKIAPQKKRSTFLPGKAQKMGEGMGYNNFIEPVPLSKDTRFFTLSILFIIVKRKIPF